METPLVASSARIATVTGPRYHPFSPRGPESVTPVAGATVSTPNETREIPSAFPATTVAYDSTTCIPSRTSKGAPYACQTPESTRYASEAAPLAASEESNEKVTLDRIH